MISMNESQVPTQLSELKDVTSQSPNLCRLPPGWLLRDCPSVVTCHPLLQSANLFHGVLEFAIDEQGTVNVLFASSSLLTVLNLLFSWVRRSSTTWASSVEPSVPEFSVDYVHGLVQQGRGRDDLTALSLAVRSAAGRGPAISVLLPRLQAD